VFMYVCVHGCACLWPCMFVYMYMCARFNIDACVFTCMWLCVIVCTCMRVRMYVDGMRVRVFENMDVCLHVCVCMIG
jgi:hypothetical protein